MDDAKQQLIDKLKSSSNILVTVSRDPSVDQLASCIGLTLLLNKQGKHTAAVFSGKVPSTLEFLKPDETLEKNTDSLRDFIIALDKAKADKLRYKVEEDVVRIFITPYKTSISEDDLEFSEGDFNVDVVIALGVKKQEDLDQAITAHGRILHDATVASINTATDGGLGTINWHDPQASSLSELITDLAQALDTNLLDSQIATALLTGIVSETGRFSNDKTSSQTMSASAALMAAGANQQLVANKLETKSSAGQGSADDASDQPAKDGLLEPDDGVLDINHAEDTSGEDVLPDAVADNVPPAASLPEQGTAGSPAPEPPVTDTGQNPESTSTLSPGAKLVTEPPTMGGTLTANSRSEQLDPVTDPLSLPNSEPPQLLGRRDDTAPPPAASPTHPVTPAAGSADAGPAMKPAPPTWTPPSSGPPTSSAAAKAADNVTLTDLEKSVGSPHVAPASLDTVRDEVSQALSGTDSTKPIEALNAQPLGNDLHPSQPSPATPPATTPVDPAAPTQPPPEPQSTDPNAPPPVPPPIPFQFGNPPPPQ